MERMRKRDKHSGKSGEHRQVMREDRGKEGQQGKQRTWTRGEAGGIRIRVKPGRGNSFWRLRTINQSFDSYIWRVFGAMFPPKPVQFRPTPQRPLTASSSPSQLHLPIISKPSHPLFPLSAPVNDENYLIFPTFFLFIFVLFLSFLVCVLFD